MAPPHDASDTAIAANLAALGLIADTVALAARRSGPEAFGHGEQAALGSARRLLMQVRSFCAVTVPDWAALRSRWPVVVLDEAFDAVTRNRGHSSVEACIETLVGSLEAISAGSATEAQREGVIEFFDDVSSTTLRRASDARWRRHRKPLHGRRVRRAAAAAVT